MRETQNRKQAPGSELSAHSPDAGLEFVNHEIMTRAEVRRLLNQLSHPGAPIERFSLLTQPEHVSPYGDPPPQALLWLEISLQAGPEGTMPLVFPTGANAQVVYSLTDSAEGHFSIEATTGVIRLEKPLRVKPQEALELTVRASDLGSPIPLSTLGTVTVSVVGLDDYLPVFLSTEHSVQVPEDAQLGTEVLQLATLTRPGAEKTGYRVVSGNEQGRFRLDARTGEPAPEATSSSTCTYTHRVLGNTGFTYGGCPLQTLLGQNSFGSVHLSRSHVPSFTLGPAYLGTPFIPPHPHPGPLVTQSSLTVCSFMLPAPGHLLEAEATLCPQLQRHEALAGIWGISSPGQGHLLPTSSPPQISQHYPLSPYSYEERTGEHSLLSSWPQKSLSQTHRTSWRGLRGCPGQIPFHSTPAMILSTS